MMIKTLDNVYINMEDFSGFTIGYPNDSDFTVMAMKELVDNQTATIELGRYPSEKEAKDALKKMIEHQDDIKKAEFFGREEGFYYISNVFTMPKPSKNGKATLDNGYGMFLTMFDYKLRDRGGQLIKVGRFFPSSQLCSHCGFKNPLVKNLSIRHWDCPNCGTTGIDRDVNAAKNIKKEGIRLLTA